MRDPRILAHLWNGISCVKCLYQLITYHKVPLISLVFSVEYGEISKLSGSECTGPLTKIF